MRGGTQEGVCGSWQIRLDYSPQLQSLSWLRELSSSDTSISSQQPPCELPPRLWLAAAPCARALRARAPPARPLGPTSCSPTPTPRRSLAHRRPKDLLHPSLEESQPLHNGGTIHKKKRLVAGPNSFFMDVKCPGCFNMYVGSAPRRQLAPLPARRQWCPAPTRQLRPWHTRADVAAGLPLPLYHRRRCRRRWGGRCRRRRQCRHRHTPTSAPPLSPRLSAALALRQILTPHSRPFLRRRRSAPTAPRCSATRRLSSFAAAALPCSASPPAARPSLRRAAATARRPIKLYAHK